MYWLQYEKEAALSLVDQEAARGAVKRAAWSAVLRTLMQAASMTFLAEWGDRSQLATVILGAREVNQRHHRKAILLLMTVP